MTKPLYALSLTAAANAITENRLTAEALVASCLERIAAREPAVRAFVQYDPDAALLAARRLDSAPRKGPRCADRGKRPDRALLCRWRRLWKANNNQSLGVLIFGINTTDAKTTVHALLELDS